MKSPYTKRPRRASPRLLKILGGIVIAGTVLICLQSTAHATSLSGGSTTVLRLRETVEDRNLYPLYEYLHFSASDTSAKGTTSFNAGIWGRVDLDDRSTDHYTNGDVQYGYLTFQGNRNNLALSAGRQFITEGVALEKLDGVYLKSELAAGFRGAFFVGAPANTSPSFPAGGLIYGGRLSHSMPRFYTLGVSALKDQAYGSSLREEEGVDLWLYPIKQVDVVGRSSYNSLTRGWMEHAYTVTFTPVSKVKITGDLARINYRDYFHHVTTSALSLTNGILDPNERVLSLGASVGVTPIAILTLSADYVNYDYDIAGRANYYGGKATVALPANASAGFSIHRMDGATDRLSYDEYRVYATKKLGKADLTVDFFDVNFDSVVNGRKNTYSLAGAAGYDVTGNLRVAADIDFSQTWFRDDEVRGLIKLTYAFEVKPGAEGRGTK